MCCVFVSVVGPSVGTAYAAGIAGVFDAGWTTAYQSQDSITHMHQRLHALGMDEVVLQYAAVEATHLYYPSQLDFLQNTQYKNNELFPKSIEAAKTVGTKIWLGLYYNGENWYTPPTAEQLDTLASRNLKVFEEIYSLYGSETVVEGVYIPQEIAHYYWDGLRSDATPEMLTEHFLKPVTETAQAKGWKVMAAPFYNQNLETPEKLQTFFEKLSAAGFKPDIIAVQDGVGVATQASITPKPRPWAATNAPLRRPAKSMKSNSGSTWNCSAPMTRMRSPTAQESRRSSTPHTPQAP